MGVPIKNLLLGFVGGCVGAVAGFLVFKLLLNFGLYGAMIPGGFTGFGFGFASRKRMAVGGIASALMGAVAGLVSDCLLYTSDAADE